MMTAVHSNFGLWQSPDQMYSFLALLAKLLLLNFLTLSNDQNPVKPRHKPFEQSLFLFGVGGLLVSAQ